VVRIVIASQSNGSGFLMSDAVGGVLVVVDEDEQRVERLDTRLTPEGVTVLHARSVGQAVELLGALGRACCVLISMTLPQRGGWELLSRLRSDCMPEQACAAVLVGPRAVLDSESMREPVIAALPTPVDFEAMCEILREHCAPKPRPTAAAASA
jgi:DNA-binding NtrC family response regulator